MDHHGSSLEPIQFDETVRIPQLTRFDETAGAPQLDNAATASELDRSALPPETVPGTSPQVLYSSTLPEANSNISETNEERALGRPSAKPVRRQLWMILGFIALASIGIGVGVGIWHNKKHSASNMKNSSAPNPDATVPPQTPNFSAPPQYILNDTSLTAVVLPGGERHLFFQDNNRLIRGAVRTSASSLWNTRLGLNVTSNATSLTPLAAIVPEPSTAMIRLYYVSEGYHLEVVQGGAAPWRQDPLFPPNYTTAAGSKHLSVSITANSTIIYYEKSAGNVSTLIQHRTHDPEATLGNYEWDDEGLLDMTEALYKSDHDIFSIPFTSTSATGDLEASQALVYSPSVTPAGGFIETQFVYHNTTQSDHESFHSARVVSSVDKSISQSDIAIIGNGDFAVWINGTRPSFVGIDKAYRSYSGTAISDSVFPFARLASATAANSSVTYLYHQINGTALAEEQWDQSILDWAPTAYIMVLE